MRFGQKTEICSPPEYGSHIWHWFWRLNTYRKIDGESAEPIPPERIAEWSRLTGETINRNEFNILAMMDMKFREAWAIEAANNAAIEKEESER
jgi:hypothetical protein